MTRFLDGPAKGITLFLKRAPIFLRVVKEDLNSATWDALDQIDDEPTSGEKVYAYIVTGKVGWGHINRGGCRGGFYPIATYKAVDPQPNESEIRTTGAWNQWCIKNDPRHHKDLDYEI